jgi:hypothetical protein
LGAILAVKVCGRDAIIQTFQLGGRFDKEEEQQEDLEYDEDEDEDVEMLLLLLLETMVH